MKPPHQVRILLGAVNQLPTLRQDESASMSTDHEGNANVLSGMVHEITVAVSIRLVAILQLQVVLQEISLAEDT